MAKRAKSGRARPVFAGRVDPETLEALNRYDCGAAGQLREDIQTLSEIITMTERSLTGRFTVAEAMLITDVLNGYFYTPGFLPSLPDILEAKVDDGCQLEGLDEKWKIDREMLVNKIKALTPMEAYTVFHMSRLVWAKNGEGDFDENVRRIFRCG